MKKRIIGLIFSLIAMTGFAAADKSYAYSLDDATNLYNLGIDYYSQDQVQKSMECFKKAIVIDPKFYEAYYNLAQIQASYGYIDAAIKSYEKVVQLKPEDLESVYELGQLLYKRGYLAKAVSYLGKIPSSSEFARQASELEAQIKKRQAELALETQRKEAMKSELQNKMTMQKTPQSTVVLKEAEEPVSTIRPAVIEQSNVIMQISAPSGVVVDEDGNIYAASFSENKVYKISPDATKSVYVEASYLGGPIGLALDENNYLYIANYTKNNVIRVTPSGVISEFAQLRKPYCISVDKLKKNLVVTEQETNNVMRYAL